MFERLDEKYQVSLVKDMIQDSRKYFSLEEFSSYPNSIKDLLDLLEQLEHGIYPSVGSLDLILASVKIDLSKFDDNMNYIRLTKISLFCKLMKICLIEDGAKREVKDVSKLPPILKLLVGKTVKATLEDLDQFSNQKNIVGSENQDLVDKIDWVKRVSHTFLKKVEYKIADCAFQHGDQVYKVWRLVKEIVPEGTSDQLESTDMQYKDVNGDTITIKLCIHADHKGAWYVSIEENRGRRLTDSEKDQKVKNPPNLIVMFKRSGCSAKEEAAIFIPYKDFFTNVFFSHQWMFCAQKIRFDQEITFCAIFNGTIVNENLSISSPVIANDCSVLVPTLSPEGATLLSVANGLSYKEPRIYPSRISLAVGVLNFSEKEIFISTPYLTSGTIDISWNKKLEASSAEVFFARKVDYSLKGTVGVTVFSIKNENGFNNLALYWSVPYERYLYVNQFALIPLETTEEITSEAVYKLYYTNTVQKAIFNARKATDGPVSCKLGDCLVSVDMGKSCRTRIQLVFMALTDLKICSQYGV